MGTVPKSKSSIEDQGAVAVDTTPLAHLNQSLDVYHGAGISGGFV